MNRVLCLAMRWLQWLWWNCMIGLIVVRGQEQYLCFQGGRSSPGENGMLFKNRTFLMARFAVILALLGGMFGAIPARASWKGHERVSNQSFPERASTNLATSALIDSPGNLDPSFDSDGLITSTFGTDHSEGRTMAIQPDGKIIVAGYRDSYQLDFALARYNNNGSLDASFGTDGRITTDFVEGGDYAQSIALQPDGK